MSKQVADEKNMTLNEAAALIVLSASLYALSGDTVAQIWRWHVVAVWPSLPELSWKHATAALLLKQVVSPSSLPDKSFTELIKQGAARLVMLGLLLLTAWALR